MTAPVAGGRRISALLAGALLVAVVAFVAPASAAPANPDTDPFYTYSGPKPLAAIAAGTVLKQRAVNVSLGTTMSTPIQAEQLLYRTSGELGEPTVTVTTVIRPATGTVLPQIIDYLSFYDALGAQCDPSYTLTGGDPGAPNRQQAEEEEALIAAHLASGSIITVPDFEGEHLEWTAGHEAGYDSLDAVRATESYLGLAKTTKVGLSGYSGGSIAADWASELAPSYSPELNIVGVAEGGIPVDFAHNLNYINGSQGWSGVIPAALVALARAYKLDLPPYLSAYGMKLTNQVQHACIGSFNGAYPGLTIQKLLKPQYQDIYKDADLVRVMNALIMGSAPGHPKGPLFMGVGDMDGTGDGIMVAKDVEALAHEYCQQGVPVQFKVYNGDSHTQAAEKFEPAAVAFLAERFAGTPFSSNCASVGAGNSLAPLQMPSGSATSPGDSGHSAGNASNAHGSLATTGISAALPLAGIAVLLVALLATEALRRQQRH
ncbi:MAG: lipase family protein [Actinomycetes bacterium]